MRFLYIVVELVIWPCKMQNSHYVPKCKIKLC